MCPRSKWSPSPAVYTLRGSRRTTALQWQRCSESCQHSQRGEEQRSWLAPEPRVRVLGLCPLVPGWDSAASRPEPGKHEQRLCPMPGLGWAQRLCSFPVFPDGSGCAMLNGKQIPILPSVLLCSHSKRVGSKTHPLRFAEGFPWGPKAQGLLQSVPRAIALLPPGHLRGMGLWPLPFNTESSAATTTKSPAAAN